MSHRRSKRPFSPNTGWICTQTDESIARHFGGAGLDLAISRRPADLMGCTLDVKTSVDQGSTFASNSHFDVPTRIPLKIP
jgi:signal transduction histidine kinase